MKRSNLKGGNAVVRILLAHGEKIGIVAISACALMLIWSAIKVPRLEQGRDPAALVSQANNAEQKISTFTWEELAQQEDLSSETAIVVRAKPMNVDATREVADSAFPNIAPVNPYVVPPQPRRTDPLLLVAEDLEVHADSGLWAEANPDDIKERQLAALKEAQKERMEVEREEGRDRENEGEYDGGRGRGRGRGSRDEREEEPERRGGAIVVQPGTGVALSGFETIRAQSWVTVLARVPYKDQVKLYEDSLEMARGYDPNRDIPEYIGYVVERAEVTAEGQGKWNRIAQVYDKVLIKEISTYPVNPPEVVASRFEHPLLTHKLPPLILKEWDNRVSHSSMPLAVDDEPPQDMLEAEDAAATEEEAAEGEEEDDGGFGGRKREPMIGGEYGGRGGYGEMDRGGYGRGGYGGEYGGRGGEYGGRGGYYGGRGEMDGEMGGRGGYYGGRGGYGSLGEGSAVELAQFTWDGKTDSVLLRFFDNSVEPGRRYRYRVQLAMTDVNDKVSLAMLEKSVTERREKINPKMRYFRLTEWSKPSPIASVPLPARLYVMSAEPVKETVVNSQPEAEMLIKALDSKYAAEIALPESFTRGAVMNVRDRAKVVWSNQYEVKQDPEFNFFTGATLVDVRGGEKLGSKNNDLIAPARAVVMDAGGKLTIQQELKDASAVKEFEAIVESPPNEQYGGRGGYGGEFDGGRGGGRGGRGGF